MAEEEGQWQPNVWDEEENYWSYMSNYMSDTAIGLSWPEIKQGDTVGLLWDAHAGNLTVFHNGKRQGFANRTRWIGEIKGDLAWVATMRASLEQDQESGIDALPCVTLEIHRRPVPVLTDEEKLSEIDDIKAMVELKKQRKIQVAMLLDAKHNPRCPACKRKFRDIPRGRRGGCGCGCCSDCC
jgi:hypothetical protein